jgi:hypothetical protein
MKLERSFGLLNELEARIHLWNASRKFQVPIRFSDDMWWIEFLMPETNLLPLDEWALLLGEALHHGRSALDAAAWEIAHLDGKTPTHPKRINFPVTESEERWEEARRRLLPDIEETYLEKIREYQPWLVTPEPGKIPWIAALAELDNRDKHRGSIVAIPSFQGIETDGMSLKFTDTSGEARVHLELMSPAVLAGLSPGTPIARLGFGEALDPTSVLPPTGHLAVFAAAITDSGVTLSVASLRDELVRYLWGIIQNLTLRNLVGRFEMQPTAPAQGSGAPPSDPESGAGAY